MSVDEEKLTFYPQASNEEDNLSSNDEEEQKEPLIDAEEKPKRHITKKLCLKRTLIIGGISILLVLLLFIIGLLVGILIFHKKTTSTYKDSICANPPVLIVSLDGFRFDYFNRHITPNIQSFADAGVQAQYMMPAFPSVTFPNHFTIVTGLYPESHGIVSNYFYDRKLDEIFYIGSPTMNEAQWWLGEPIWVTASKTGLKTAVYFWPGSEVPIQGIYPDTYFNYSKSVPFSERVQTVLSWFDQPDHIRPQFIASYFNEPDSSGHEAGPNSTAVDQALVKVDKVIEQYINGLTERGIFDCVNFIIVSDHGMATVEQQDIVILIPDLLPESYHDVLEHEDYGIFVSLYINESDPEIINTVYNIIKENATNTNAPVDVYLQDEAPEEFHIGHYNKQRYGDIFIIARLGSYIKFMEGYPSAVTIGNHGYDNREPLMRTIFLSHGPAFKEKYRTGPVENINVYELMCDLLSIRPSANNGTLDAMKDLLKPSNVTN